MPEHTINPFFATVTSKTAAGETLCFDKNEFMKTNFSVDEFLHKNRSAPSLEQLRDNLGLYLKGLRASMIDLINEDYADFVSLSANLVGLDSTIDVIVSPLNQFRTEVEGIQEIIKENESEIRTHLEHKNQLRELKRNLQALKKVYEAMQKLEDLLNQQLSTENLNAVDLERAALELLELKFNERFCTVYLDEKQRKNMNKLELEVQQKLRAFFNKALQTSTSTCSESLERCLRIYITLDSCHLAEIAFREDVVAPYMTNIISEHSLQNALQGLSSIYTKILNFISLHMTDLLRLTQYTDKLRGYNFLVHSFWSDVEMRLETYMSSIFAPGNSDVFYVKYKCTRDFLNKIEELLADEQSIQNFRKHKQTKSFQARWNLPVYFQICFQEIAGKFEATLDPLIRANSLKDFSTAKTVSEYQLKPFRAASNAVDRCWTEGVFLSEVFPKFYKLTVQIILRLSHWISDILRLSSSSNKNAIPAGVDKMQLLIVLHVDIQKWLASLPLVQETILQHIPIEKRSSSLVCDTVKKSFADLQQVFVVDVRQIQSALIAVLVTESGLENIRQVSDLPRLYRKTNREIPTRSSAYVEQMLRPLKTFVLQQRERLGGQVLTEVLKQVFERITLDYFKVVSEVLTSVQRTEESLRRLRNFKSGATLVQPMITSASSPALSSAAMSDDDKIRLQLRVDVAAWTDELAKLHFMPTEITKLLDLNRIVEESIKQKEGNH